MGKFTKRVDYRSFIVDDTPKAITPGEGTTAERVVEDYLAGAPSEYILHKYDISNGQLNSHLTARGIQRRNSKQKRLYEKLMAYTDEEVHSILKDYRVGVPVEKIMDTYDLHKNGLYTLLDLNRVPRRSLQKKVTQ